jgi:hypothetical protein
MAATVAGPIGTRVLSQGELNTVAKIPTVYLTKKTDTALDKRHQPFKGLILLGRILEATTGGGDPSSSRFPRAGLLLWRAG